jgi:hypothetical protein
MITSNEIVDDLLLKNCALIDISIELGSDSCQLVDLFIHILLFIEGVDAVLEIIAFFISNKRRFDDTRLHFTTDEAANSTCLLILVFVIVVFLLVVIHIIRSTRRYHAESLELHRVIA